jgi:hypothetical protein
MEEITLLGAIKLGLMLLAIVGIPAAFMIILYFLTREREVR